MGCIKICGDSKKKKKRIANFHVPSIDKIFPNRNLMLERHAGVCHYLNKFMLLRNVILMPVIELIFQEKKSILNVGDNRIVSLPPYWTVILRNREWKGRRRVLTVKNSQDLLFSNYM